METKNVAAQEEQKTIREQIGMTDEQFIEMGRIGAVYYEQGNFEKAQTIFEGLVELDPTRADAQASLGAVLAQTWQNEVALEHLNRAIELDAEQIAPYVSRAEVLIRQQKLEEAVADLRRAIELDPEEADQGANRARAIVLGLHEAFQAKEAEGVM